MLIVMNHALGSFGRPSVFSSVKKAMRSGRPEPTARPPQLARNMRTEVRMVISLVSRVRAELRAPYGTLMNVYRRVIAMYVT